MNENIELLNTHKVRKRFLDLTDHLDTLNKNISGFGILLSAVKASKDMSTTWFNFFDLTLRHDPRTQLTEITLYSTLQKSETQPKGKAFLNLTVYADSQYIGVHDIEAERQTLQDVLDREIAINGELVWGFSYMVFAALAKILANEDFHVTESSVDGVKIKGRTPNLSGHYALEVKFLARSDLQAIKRLSQ